MNVPVTTLNHKDSKKDEADGQQPQCDGGEAEGAAVAELYHSFLLDGSMT